MNNKHMFSLFVVIVNCWVLVLVQGNNEPRNDQYDRSADSTSSNVYGLAIDKEHDYVHVGDKPVCSCTVEMTIQDLIRHSLRWEKVGRDGSRIEISNLVNVKENLQSEYAIEMDSSSTSLTIKLRFLEGITQNNDGFLYCSLYNRAEQLLAERKIEVAVTPSSNEYGLAIDKEQDYVHVGDKPVYSCTVEMTVQDLIRHSLKWEKVGRDGARVVISNLVNVKESLQSEYTIELDSSSTSITIKLRFLQGITENDDGFLYCSLYNRTEQLLAERKIEVDVTRVCQGLNSGLGMSGSSQDQYDLYRQRYTNCKYVDGNLEITYLDDTGNWDLSFLESIVEVSGYVLISSVLSQKLHLQNLRLIRGRQLFLDKFSLLVYSNSKPGSRTQGLMELEFRSLQEIMNGTVFISENNLLCHASTIRWEDINPTVTQHFRTSMDIPGYKRSCGECDAACYNENTGSRHCWGEGPDMCQIINHGPACSPTCTDRCFGEDPSQCCHSECAAGCSGPKATDCYLLVFGQESNNLPESAASSRVCQGLNSGLGMSGSSQDQYDLYRQRYTNCKYVDGNLEITYLDDTGNWDLSFLESIEEVSGYVLISSVLSQKLHLQNLRLIRGRQLFLDKFSLLVASNSKPGSRTQGLMELEFRSLQEIMNGTVFISMNNLLCHASTIRWEDINPTVTQHFRTSMDIPGYKRSCGECDAACYNENTGSRHCWGEGPDMCQIINHGPACSPTCTYRCFGEDPSQCCHSECAAGCSGPKATDCYVNKFSLSNALQKS
ncbi:epidermal growth factor receptor-like [Mytilus trossulus]|uniref:epidermal growth factor receptor-like n=1 Tax=Mytilus trossulus TaxID=6551 RepID=UPI0030047548